MTHAQFLDCVHRLLFDIGFGAVGAIIVVGAYRGWKWLVDPSLSWSPYYSQAKFKEIFGQTALVYFTYFLGLIFFAFSCFITYRDVAFCRLLSQPPPHWVHPSN
jgi:hypothetical protein